jgi:hypothetical protein
VRTKSLPSDTSIEARVMRASGAITNSAMVKAGNINWRAAAHQPSRSPASRKSMIKKPVREGGSVVKTSTRPVGSGASPSRY